jgi:hypothetical protein
VLTKRCQSKLQYTVYWYKSRKHGLILSWITYCFDSCWIWRFTLLIQRLIIPFIKIRKMPLVMSFNRWKKRLNYLINQSKICYCTFDLWKFQLADNPYCVRNDPFSFLPGIPISWLENWFTSISFHSGIMESLIKQVLESGLLGYIRDVLDFLFS